MKRLLPLALLLTACGRANQELLPYLGKWNGEFAVLELPGSTEADRERETLRGFLVVWATKRTYQLHLEGEQESFDVRGEWSLRGRQIVLRPKDVTIDDGGGEDRRDPNRKWIPPEEIRAAYAAPLALTLSQNEQSLLGADLALGPRLGVHRFRRGD